MLPGNAILLNGVTQTANREIGVPRSARLTRQSQRRGSLLCGNPNAADKILESRLGAQGVEERKGIEHRQARVVLIV